MTNVLKMEKQILIKQLLELGWSYRRIETETGIRRETVARYDPNHPKNLQEKTTGSPKPAKVTAGGSENRPKCPPTSSTENLQKPTRRSAAADYDEFIRKKLTSGLTAQRIYQDLVTEKDFENSYECVKRYVRKLKCKEPEVFARIHTAPGEEGQVDFGQRCANTQERPLHAFLAFQDGSVLFSSFV